MSIKLGIPQQDRDLKPHICVVGVGGAGGNAVNNMIRSNLEGVDFIVANTDAQSLALSVAPKKIQLGLSVTQGLGAGARPEIGRAAAEEAMDEIAEQIKGAHMVFIAAGMGGGTGSGAAPVIAEIARENNALTVGVVTKPFHFEGTTRMRIAEEAIEELQEYVDTLIIIPNQNLFRVANEKTTFADAFKMADDVLYSGVRGVTDLMVMPGLINLDFADIRSVMSEMGKAMMGTGEAEGERRAIDAAEAAISNPLLEDVSMKGARGVLINITGGMDMTLYEVDEAANRIRDEVDPEANIIFGSTFDESFDGKMRVSVVATGIEAALMKSAHPSTSGAQMPKPTSRPLPSMSATPAAARPAAGPAAMSAAPVTAAATGANKMSFVSSEDSFGEKEARAMEKEFAGEDRFIAPAAIEVADDDMQNVGLTGEAEPFAAAAFENAGKENAKENAKAAPSLSFGFSSAQPVASDDGQEGQGGGMSQSSLSFHAIDGGKSASDETSATGEESAEGQKSPPPLQVNMNDRIAGDTSKKGGSFEDILDIPTFLRNQMN